MGQLITTEQQGRILIAKFANPPLELINDPMVQELDALVARADTDPGVGVVVLTGTHPERFITHYDVDELLENSARSPAVSKRQAKIALSLIRRLSRIPGAKRLLKKTPAAGIVQLQDFHEILLRMGRSGAIFIAAINGRTAGGGLELALACDLRFISDRGEVAQPEVLLGHPPGGGATQRLARLIGRANALDILLTGRFVSASEAQRLGLVTASVAHDDLMEEVLRVAARLARRYKPSIAVIKQAVLGGGSLSLTAGLETEQAGFLAMLYEPRTRAAMRAYVAHTREAKDVPAYDPATKTKLADGLFIDFNE